MKEVKIITDIELEEQELEQVLHFIKGLKGDYKIEGGAEE